MTLELVDWIEKTYGTEYDSIDCEQILQRAAEAGQSDARHSVVPDSYCRTVEILEAKGGWQQVGTRRSA